MKKLTTSILISIIVSIALIASIVPVKAADYLWPFSTSANPAQSVTTTLGASVTPGMFSMGWVDDIGISTNRGFWDLGAAGTITATFSGTSTSAVVETVELYDGWIYGTYASVTIPGATLTSQSYVTVETIPNFFGVWVKHTQTFSLPGNGWNLTVTGAQWGSVLGSLHVSD